MQYNIIWENMNVNDSNLKKKWLEGQIMNMK